jgi:P4 family phage/plasmid primase-like protien
MWNIKTSTNESFIVNTDHILSLKIKNSWEIRKFMNKISKEEKYILNWYEYDENMFLKQSSKAFNSFVLAEYYNNNILQQTPSVIKENDIIDIKVGEYLKYINMMGNGNFRLFRPKKINFDVSINQNLLKIHPFLLGQWLIGILDDQYIDDKFQANLKYYGLSNDKKFIPIEYINTSRFNRKVLMSALIYYDITETENGYSFRISNNQLLKDTLYLIRTIGDVCYQIHDTIYVENEEECIDFVVEKHGVDDYFGFQLDGNHRYMMDNCIVTHNSNGKSVCVELFEKAIGQYTCKFPITLLTQKRAASNAATGELARAKGRRLAVLQEPSEDEKLQVGLMKELTGGDTIMCRALYKDPIEYKPQYKLILLCNHLPSVPSDDGGTWRRIRVIEFTSKFVDNPKEDNEFPIDLELSSKFDIWKEHFISMLLNVYYPIVQAGPISEPEDVLMCTREYQNNNDHMSHFIQLCIEKSNNSFLSADDAFTELKNWVRDDNVPFKVPKKNEFVKVLERKMGKGIRNGGCITFKGFKIRNRYAKTIIENDDDIDF